MKKMLKKVTAFLMVVVNIMTIGNITTVFAADNEYNFIGTNEIYLTSSMNYSALNATDSDIVLSYTEDEKGNYAIYTYTNGSLTEINEYSLNNDYIVTKNFLDGNIVSSEKIYFDVVTKEQPTPYAYKRIGTMEYTHDITGEVLKITVSRDDSTVEKEVTFKDGKYTFAQVVAMVGAAFAIPAVKTVEGIVTIIFGNSIVNAGLDVIGTKKVVGEVTTYTWKGVPSDTSKGKTAYLDGRQIKYKDKNGNSKTHTEGYLPSAWKTDPFGRWMFYKTYGIEVYPTKWY